MATATELIAELADEFNSLAMRIDGETLELKIGLLRADGLEVPYTIIASSTGETVKAKEKSPVRLPSFCPERHINPDGSFCLYWEGDARLEVTDESSATVWWETLYQFLRHQERAAKLRRWPTAGGWAHGDAARFQKRAIASAEGLGSEFLQALLLGRLQVRAWPLLRKNRDSTLRMYRDGVHIYSIWSNQAQVLNRKQRCFCQRKKGKRALRLRSCGTHAADAANLAKAIHEWKKSEIRFWNQVEGRRCCRTCERCPLADREDKDSAGMLQNQLEIQNEKEI
jgi:hypothetical protein